MVTSPLCPVCKTIGKPVGTQTVKALLTATLRQVEDSYLFCKNSECLVVYFANNGSHYFTTEQVREHIYQKRPTDDTVNVCYCFLHTAGEIKYSSSELQNNIVANINAGIKANQCACDLRNPQGDCCLGNVRTLIKSSQSKK